MAQPSVRAYPIDDADPRAPTVEVWQRMSEQERRDVVEGLPARIPFEAHPPEGDLHRTAKNNAVETLEAFFRSQGKRIYISSELATFYPGEKRISPDLLAVLDVEDHPRSKWVVSAEGKGLDWALEVVYAGNFKKDAVDNVERFARLGIPEYFIFDRRELMLSAYRLPAGSGPRSYVQVLARGGLYASAVLGLSVGIEGERLRFYAGTAPLLEAEERLARLTSLTDALIEKRDRAEAQAIAAKAQASAASAQAILDICELLGLEVTPVRRAHLETLDVQGLDTLRGHLMHTRAWPEP